MLEKRIISLLPAATDIICALGLGGYLVGRSHECDFSEDVLKLPVCSNTKLVSGGSSAGIDKQVKDLLSDALSIYAINTDLIKSLNPTHIITQSQCEVCAVSLGEVELNLQNVLDQNVKLISLNPANLEDVFNEIALLAKEFRIEDHGNILVEDLRDRSELIHHKLKFVEKRPSVLCIEWLSPLMAAGNWTPDLIEIAGGKSLLAKNSKHSSYIDFMAIAESNPDIIIVAPCGFAINRTLQEISLLLDLPGWNELNAVKNAQIYIADGNQYFNRSSQKLVDTIEILAEIIHPKQFVFGYEVNGWLKFGVN